ncbi:DNA methyltransferase [Arthrobacter phage MidnightRain]|nr:DNA methyltransferase [Arthrobacter phage MidnightRain]
MRAGEFCAGYGGLMMAIEQVFRAEPAWVSEFDPAPSKILAYHYPTVPNLGDMTKVDWSRVDLVDVMGGGTPCQDLSHAGARKGMTEGTRSNLWVHMREAIAIQRPLYVVWENVRGAYSADADSDLEFCPGCMGEAGDRESVLRALGRVLGDLSDLGYDVQWRGLRASDVGAPHARFRVFVLARRRDARDADLAHVEGSRSAGWADADQEQSTRPDRSASDGYRTAASSDSDGRTCGRSADAGSSGRWPAEVQGVAHADSLGHERGGEARGRRAGPQDGSQSPADSESVGRGEGWTESERVIRGLASSSDRAPAAHANHATGDGQRARTEPREGSETSPDPLGGGRPGRAREAGREAGEGTLAERSSEGTRSPSDAQGNAGREFDRDDVPVVWGEYEPAIRRWERAIGRHAPRPTEPTGRGGGERLSPRFTEWMMGLPDGWVTDPAIGISRNEQLKACGNGVVPQQAIAALRDMLAAFQKEGIAA